MRSAQIERHQRSAFVRRVSAKSEVKRRPAHSHYGAEREKWELGRRSDGLARAAACVSRRVTGLLARVIARGLGHRSGQAVGVTCHRVAREMESSGLAGELDEPIKRLHAD